MNPKVSIIMPTINRARLLPRAIESVLSQSFRNFEFIIVDDGSTDDTKKVIKSYKDPRIRYIRYESNQGIPTARNRGIKEAKGQYIAWQDDDDEWLERKLEKQVCKIEKLPSDYGVVYVGYWRYRKDGKKVYFPPKWVDPKEGNLYRVFLKKNFLPLQAMIFRREVFDRVGGLDKRYLVLGEYDWFPRIAKIFKFAYIPEPLVILHHSILSNSQNNILNAKTRDMFVRENKDDLIRFGYLGYHYGVIGDLYMDGGKSKKASHYLFKAAVHNPLKLTHWLKATLALLGINYKNLKKKIPFFKSGKEFKI